MITKLLNYWLRIRSSFWFVPALMVITAIALSYITMGLDQIFEREKQTLLEELFVYRGGAESAAMILSTIAGSMITVAGVVFSITMVVLSLTTSQFGPRLIRNFLNDITHQIVLGTFIATFIYCMLSLYMIGYREIDAPTPVISVTIGVLLALTSLGLLIYFVHNVASSIQANNVIAVVGHELNINIDRLYPLENSETDFQPESAAPKDDYQELLSEINNFGFPVTANSNGYIQLISTADLIALATEKDARFKLVAKPGLFITRGEPLVMVYPADRYHPELRKRINAQFIFGRERTMEQDIGFAVGQLAEIAVRALSPGVNDPVTAISCVDWLGAALSNLVARPIPSPFHLDRHDQLRLIYYPPTFPEVLDEAFSIIRQYARTDTAVTLRLLEVISVVMKNAGQRKDRQALFRHAAIIRRASRQGLADEWDRLKVERKYRTIADFVSPGRHQDAIDVDE